ncbi:MAG: DUF4845 domain-containing protein [Gammaproteobacteria bacterium]|nr:DUF4845 domain-containing protein [Gammaproteobacteria bacterium]
MKQNSIQPRVTAFAAGRQQRGLTFISFLIVLIVLMSVGYLGLKMVPHYINFYSVKSSMNSVAEESRVEAMSVGQMRSNLLQKLNVNFITNISPQDIKFSRTASGNLMTVDYRTCESIVANVEACMDFKHSVMLGLGR